MSEKKEAYVPFEGTFKDLTEVQLSVICDALSIHEQQRLTVRNPSRGHMERTAYCTLLLEGARKAYLEKIAASDHA